MLNWVMDVSAVLLIKTNELRPTKKSVQTSILCLWTKNMKSGCEAREGQNDTFIFHIWVQCLKLDQNKQWALIEIYNNIWMQRLKFEPRRAGEREGGGGEGGAKKIV